MQQPLDHSAISIIDRDKGVQRNWGDHISLATYTNFGTSPLVIKRDYKDVRHAYRHPPQGGGCGFWQLSLGAFLFPSLPSRVDGVIRSTSIGVQLHTFQSQYKKQRIDKGYTLSLLIIDLITRPTEQATIREDYEGVLGQIWGYVFPNFKYLQGFLYECHSLMTVQVQEQSRVSYLVRIKRVASLRNGLPVRPQLKVEGAMRAKDFRHHLVDLFRVRDFQFSTRYGFCNEWQEYQLQPRCPNSMRFSQRKLGGHGSRHVF